MRRNAFILTLLFCLAAVPSKAANIFVDDGCPNPPGTGTQADPFCTVQDGIDAAANEAMFPGPDEVRVAQGTYTEDALISSQTVGITLRGGFEDGFPSDTPDPATFVTVLQGSVDRPLTVEFSENIAVEGFRIEGGRTASFPGGGGLLVDTSTARITNNVITGNLAAPTLRGGGVLVYGQGGGGQTVLEANDIYNNATEGGPGGGLAIVSSDARAYANRIADNTSIGDLDNQARGGGVFLYFSYGASLDDNLIEDNTALAQQPLCFDGFDPFPTGNGGGIFLRNSGALVTNNIIRRNHAEVADTSVVCRYSASGGGLYAAYAPDLLVADNLVQENTATGAAFTPDPASPDGDFQGLGAGLYMRETGAAVTRNVLVGNIASGGSDASARGGGAYLSTVVYPLLVERATVTGNQADEGGGLHLSDEVSSLRVYDSRIRGNTANVRGAGLVASGYPFLHDLEVVDNLGSGLTVAGDRDLGVFAGPVVTNVTIAGNQDAGLETDYIQDFVLRDSILWSNAGGDAVDADLPTPFDHPTTVAEYNNIGSLNLGGTNISADPVFVTGDNGDYYLGRAALDGVPSDSPSIDAGSSPASAAPVVWTRTTRTDGEPDVCRRDQGYHYARLPQDLPPEGDNDGDTVPNADDNCPTVANGPAEDDQADSDGDGVGDACESPDTDADGLPDAAEALLGSDPQDADSDDDGVPDGADCFGDTDGDTLPDVLDCDSDNDGIHDGTELGLTSSVPDPDGGGPLLGTDESAMCDEDGDGTLDAVSWVPDCDAETTDPLLADTDGGCEPDGSEDANRNGCVDAGESNPNNPDDDDADLDGLTNQEETFQGLDPLDSDSDDDGVPDGPDGLDDSDGDGLIDAMDCDADNDGLRDGTEVGVTTALAPLPGTCGGQPFLATDETADCDADNDGISDGPAFIPDADPSNDPTDPKDADTDGDLCPDGTEDADRDGAFDGSPGECIPTDPQSFEDCCAGALPEVTGLRISRMPAAAADLDVSFEPVAAASTHRVYKGTLGTSWEYDYHVSEAPAWGACSTASPWTDAGAAADPQNFTYLVVAVAGSGAEGSFGLGDLDGDGSVDDPRPVPGDPGFPLVTRDCPP